MFSFILSYIGVCNENNSFEEVKCPVKNDRLRKRSIKAK